MVRSAFSTSRYVFVIGFEKNISLPINYFGRSKTGDISGSN